MRTTSVSGVTECCHLRRSPKDVQISSTPQACGGAASGHQDLVRGQALESNKSAGTHDLSLRLDECFGLPHQLRDELAEPARLFRKLQMQDHSVLREGGTLCGSGGLRLWFWGRWRRWDGGSSRVPPTSRV